MFIIGNKIYMKYEPLSNKCQLTATDSQKGKTPIKKEDDKK